jgi:hypothetical protein
MGLSKSDSQSLHAAGLHHIRPTQIPTPRARTSPTRPTQMDRTYNNKEGITRIQQIIDTLLYYARSVDPTMLQALGTIAAQQAYGTEATATAVTHLLDYAATHPNATI